MLGLDDPLQRWPRFDHPPILLRLAVYKRSVKRPNIINGDRIFWLTVMRMLRAWRCALVFVQPDTVVRWQYVQVRLVC